jgi:hypothetical protein
MVVSTAGAEVIGADHNFIAVPVTAGINTSCDANSEPLTITVTQAGVPATIDWSLTCLPQINQSTNLALPTATANEFSEVLLTGSAKLTASDNMKPLIVRATADISIGGALDMSGSGATPGPGAAGGGAAAMAGAGAGGGAPGGTLVGGGGGGGAGYHDKGAAGTEGAAGDAVGDPALTGGYAANYASGGGGASGAGGGGGGTIELTAGGSLSTKAITSTGAGGAGGLYGAGGGAGGTIVLRGGTSITLGGALSVAGGAGANSGGDGSPGRIRIDTPMLTGTPPSGTYMGLSIDPATPYITNSAMPTVTIHGTAGVRYDLFTLDKDGNIKDEMDGKLLTGATAQIMPPVHWGYNRVCIAPTGANPTVLESSSCVDIAFLP